MARPWLGRLARRCSEAAREAAGPREAPGSCRHSSGRSGGEAAGVHRLQQVLPPALGVLAQLQQQQQQHAHAALSTLGETVSMPRGTLLVGGAVLLGGGVFLGAHSDWLSRQVGDAPGDARHAEDGATGKQSSSRGSSSSSSSSDGVAGEAYQRPQQWLAGYLSSFLSHSQARGSAAPAATTHTTAELRSSSSSNSISSAAGAAPMGGCLSPYFISDAAAKAAPAVVNITVQGPVLVGSSGSGFIVDADGTILTNAHVVSDAIQRHYFGGPSGGGSSSSSSSGSNSGGSSGAGGSSGKGGEAAGGGGSGSAGVGGKGITVTLQDGRIFEGRLVSYDTVSDLAVLKVDSDAPLPTARLGRSASLRVGEWVVALGSPLHLQNSVTAGIVSCVDRKAVELGLAGARTDYIQTDAAINKGNSGGPLVNLFGEVVGISAMKAVAADGVSFAIPVDTAVDVMRQLREHGRVIRPYVGIKMLQLNKHNAAQFRKRDPNFPRVESGILVPGVHAGSPAERAGLKAGDIIIGFAGRTRDVTTTALIKALGEHVGRPLELRVARPGDKIETLSVVSQEATDGVLR